MADTRIQVLVAGADGLAEALEASGRFTRVHRCAATSQLREMIAQGLLGGVSQRDLVFVFSDQLPSDTANVTVATLVAKLTAGKWRVIVLETSPAGRPLVQANPGAGLLPMPVTVNNVLGAIAGMGLGLLEPVDEAWGNETVALGDAGAVRAMVAVQATWGAQPGTSASMPTASPTFRPAAAPTGWAAEAVQVPAPATGWGAQGGWDAEPVGPAPQPSPQPAPQHTATPQPAPVSCTDAAPGWGAQEAAWAPEPQPEPVAAQPGEAWAPQPVGTQPSSGWASQPAAPPAAWSPEPQAEPWPETPAAAVAAPWMDTTPASPAPWGDDSGWQDTPAPHTPDVPVAPAATTGPQPVSGPWDTAPASTPWSTEASGWNDTPADEPQGWNGWGGATAPAPLAAAAAVRPALPKRRGLVIGVTTAKGGVGKSALTLNLAVHYGTRMRNRAVCVVDANRQQADVGKQIGAYTPNISNLVRSMEDLNPAQIGRHMVRRPEINTDFLLGPSTPEEANPVWITPQLYGQAIEVLRQLYDVTWVDLPVAERFHEMFEEFALPSVDYLLVPVEPDYPTLENTDRWLRAITKPKSAGGCGVDPRRIGIVINKAEDDIGMGSTIQAVVQDVMVNLAAWQFVGVIPASKEFKKARNQEEILATRHVPEISQAFARILYNITGDEELRAEAEPPGEPTKSRGLFSKLRSSRRGK